ncbi:hypothetical protein OPV22_002520 [Ensete ventricosum]|uniref:Uncharacterized protein n=1 Tax=Ensete ventricosum TaxID=4639 RepID=A0AAV8RY42_ENSVE|nr:hypothetical protein OPV22_002520 [Ensete ventricosum]
MRKCRFQPLAAAGIASVPVPSPSADLHNPGAIALLQQALRVAVPSPSADFSHERCCSGGSKLGTLEPPGWHRAGWGIRVAGKVPPVASFALRRSPLARAAQNGQFWPVFGPFLRAAVGAVRVRLDVAFVVAGKVCCPPLRSPSVARRSLWRPKTASFGLFLGRFWRAAATAVSGAKRQPSQHPRTPRVAQGWMGLSYSREGAARRFVRSPPLAARSGGPKRPVLACFWAVFACCGRCGERSSGRGIRVAGKVLPFASFAVRRSPLARAAKNGQFWPVFGPFFACHGDRGERCETSAISAPWNPPGGTGLDGAFV